MRKYVKPALVISPKNHISNIRVIHDGGVENLSDTFSIAKVDWDDEEKVAVRWNVGRNEWDDIEKEKGKTKCKGMPMSRLPVWFILPDELVNRDSEIWKMIDKSMQKK